MISTQHANAKEYFDRDVNCVVKFFAMKMRYVASEDMIPQFEVYLYQLLLSYECDCRRLTI